jgi:hypothetical protein
VSDRTEAFDRKIQDAGNLSYAFGVLLHLAVQGRRIDSVAAVSHIKSTSALDLPH